MNVHYFNDKDPLHRLISPTSWFYRFTLTWKNSLEPTASFGILDVGFYTLSCFLYD